MGAKGNRNVCAPSQQQQVMPSKQKLQNINFGCLCLAIIVPPPPFDNFSLLLKIKIKKKYRDAYQIIHVQNYGLSQC